MESKAIAVAQVMPQGLYTARELRCILARYRQQRVPDRTLRWWRSQIGLLPNEDGLYSEDDLQILIQLVRWLSRGGTVQQFFSNLQEKYNGN